MLRGARLPAACGMIELDQVANEATEAAAAAAATLQSTASTIEPVVAGAAQGAAQAAQGAASFIESPPSAIASGLFTFGKNSLEAGAPAMQQLTEAVKPLLEDPDAAASSLRSAVAAPSLPSVDDATEALSSPLAQFAPYVLTIMLAYIVAKQLVCVPLNICSVFVLMTARMTAGVLQVDKTRELVQPLVVPAVAIGSGSLLLSLAWRLQLLPFQQGVSSTVARTAPPAAVSPTAISTGISTGFYALSALVLVGLVVTLLTQDVAGGSGATGDEE
jgi:hypothetical protein